MTHSAILWSQHHAQVVMTVLPGNPQLALSSVAIQDVSFNDASKISAEIARHGLPALVWEPPITATAEAKPPVPTEPTPEPPLAAEPTPPEPEQPA